MTRDNSEFSNISQGHTSTDDGTASPTPNAKQRFSEDLVAEAREIFQRRSGRTLTNEDARQILENLVGFFSTLNQWDRKQER